MQTLIIIAGLFVGTYIYTKLYSNKKQPGLSCQKNTDKGITEQ